MILVHELGHYWAARFFDVKIEAFSFGFGPRLFGFKRGETDFRFCAILFGGYVKMAGEQFGDMTDPGDQNVNHDPRNFLSKPRWQRMIISFAGPAINLVLAVALLTGLNTQHYLRIPLPHSPVVGVVTADRHGVSGGNSRRRPGGADRRYRESDLGRRHDEGSLRRQAGYAGNGETQWRADAFRRHASLRRKAGRGPGRMDAGIPGGSGRVLKRERCRGKGGASERATSF